MIYLGYRLKKWLKRPATRKRFLLVAVLSLMLVFVDQIVVLIQPAQTTVFGLPEELLKADGFIGTLDEQQADIVVQMGRPVRIILQKPVKKETIYQLETLIHDPLKQDILIIEDYHDQTDERWLFIAVFYFFLLSITSSVARQVMEDKLTGWADFLLCSISAGQHLSALHIYVWLQRLMMMGWSGLWLMVGFAGHMRLDGMSGWQNLMTVTYDARETDIWMLPGMLVALMPVLRIISIRGARVQKAEDMSSALLGPCAVLLGMFYALVALAFNHNSSLMLILGFVPVANLLAIPLSATTGASITTRGFMTLWALIMDISSRKWLEKRYQRALLHYSA